MNKYKSNSWKDKLREVQKARKLEQQRIRRLEQSVQKLKASRDYYKQKYEDTVKAIPFDLGIRPYNYHYQSGIIKMAIELQVIDNISYRQCSQVLERIFNFFDIDSKSPSPSTIRQWVLKQGCYELNHSDYPIGDYVMIVDESIGIGQEKCLLILGVNEGKWQASSRALSYSDTEVLELGSQRSWTQENISRELGKASEKVEGNVKYVVSDRDSRLLKAISLQGEIHVPDCTHWMANCLKRYLKTDEEFKQLQSHLGKVRQRLVNGKYVGMIAPNMRTKSRFLNLYEITSWMQKLLTGWSKLNSQEQEKVKFLKAYPYLIQELIELINLVKSLASFLKIEGITVNSQQKIKKIFSSVKCKTNRIKQFEQDMLCYVEKVQKSLPVEKRIICCSDIIESYFGKMKNRGNNTTSKGITEDILSMTLFKGNITNAQVLQGMEFMTMQKVQKWSTQNMALSFPKMKRRLWRKLAS